MFTFNYIDGNIRLFTYVSVCVDMCVCVWVCMMVAVKVRNCLKQNVTSQNQFK